MWIVRLALKQPHTIVVMAILILILGSLASVRTPTDIFPNINIPVVSIIWSFNGLAPQDMADRIISVTERSLTTLVDDIGHIESQSLNGIAVVKVFLQPNANIDKALAQSAALVYEVTAVNIQGRLLASAVLLIQALGGGWDRSALPEHPECCGRLIATSK
jgi:multidrug efflux pump subunit AcrB